MLKDMNRKLWKRAEELQRRDPPYPSKLVMITDGVLHLYAGTKARVNEPAPKSAIGRRRRQVVRPTMTTRTGTPTEQENYLGKLVESTFSKGRKEFTMFFRHVLK